MALCVYLCEVYLLEVFFVYGGVGLAARCLIDLVVFRAGLPQVRSAPRPVCGDMAGILGCCSARAISQITTRGNSLKNWGFSPEKNGRINQGFSPEGNSRETPAPKETKVGEIRNFSPNETVRKSGIFRLGAVDTGKTQRARW